MSVHHLDVEQDSGCVVTVSGDADLYAAANVERELVRLVDEGKRSIVVDLTDVANQYGAYAMANGSTLLLPIYLYSGHDIDTQNPETFRVISVDPAYLDLSLAVRPQIY